MQQAKPRLSDFSHNTYSQFGEDGIIEKIFEILQPRSKICVEFGAWEGFYDANTALLWSQKGWKAVLIEGDAEKFRQLVENVKPYSCTALHEFVEARGEHSVDAIMNRLSITDLDILSIDIDGGDYFILEHLERIRPRLIICEYNPTIPKELELVGTPGSRFGCSSLALTKLAERKGYRLIAMTDTNCFFVTEADFSAFSDFETDHDAIFPGKHLTYLITDYDGRFSFSKKPTYGFTQPFSQGLSLGEVFRIPSRNYFKLGLKKIYYSSAAESVRMALSVIRWYATGKKGCPPHAIKVKAIKQIVRTYQLYTFIETGTYLGQMVDAIKSHFSQIHSIEISEKLYRRAKKRFQTDAHVHIHHGDSATVLSSVLSTLTQPALFWLDGHYSGGITGKGEKETPIVQELEQIFAHPIKNHVILIDDARCFDGTHDYPTMAELTSRIISLSPQASVHIVDDMILITPNPSH